MARGKREAHWWKAVFRRLTTWESVIVLALRSSQLLSSTNFYAHENEDDPNKAAPLSINQRAEGGGIVIEREVTKEYQNISAGIISGIFLATSARDTKKGPDDWSCDAMIMI